MTTLNFHPDQARLATQDLPEKHLDPPYQNEQRIDKRNDYVYGKIKLPYPFNQVTTCFFVTDPNL